MIIRKNGESEFEYHKRLIYGKLVDKTLSDIDYTELAKEVYGKEYSSDVARRMMYGSKYTLDLIDRAQMGNVDCDETLKQIKNQQRELQKERYKLQTEKIELNRWIREQSRIELWEEKMKDIANNLPKLEMPNYRVNKGNSSKVGITGIADVHFGKEISIKGLMGETINTYNEDIFKERMYMFLHKLIPIIEKENLDRLDFYMLGDLVDGVLRISQLQSLQYGVVDSVMKFSDFMAQWLNELSKYVYLDVYTTTGNHSEIRHLNSKSGDFPHENVERLICWYLKARLSDNKNIKIHDANKVNLVNTLGVNVFSVHGQDERDLEKSLKEYSFMYCADIDIMLSGHLHSNNSKSIGMSGLGNVEYIQFPSICGVDEFSMKLKRTSMPGSRLIVVEEGVPDRINYDIVLNFN